MKTDIKNHSLWTVGSTVLPRHPGLGGAKPETNIYSGQ